MLGNAGKQCSPRASTWISTYKEHFLSWFVIHCNTPFLGLHRNIVSFSASILNCVSCKGISSNVWRKANAHIEFVLSSLRNRSHIFHFFLRTSYSAFFSLLRSAHSLVIGIHIWLGSSSFAVYLTSLVGIDLATLLLLPDLSAFVWNVRSKALSWIGSVPLIVAGMPLYSHSFRLFILGGNIQLSGITFDFFIILHSLIRSWLGFSPVSFLDIFSRSLFCFN